ncbi:hypothetical protein Dsin_031641 [Dipteronia sinensis]|uniref:Late embryogenesis abundant protein LEA-2 subgroup domain-containing protein n=1 Tax=Dipteronia sinensis TaxID=43782 RepID=A0AAE0DTK2_9ROSI|nr:hypothetical protein Dsin_031641 [Dipteronia sinensis]
MADYGKSSRRRGLKICCGVSAIVLVVFITVVTTLALTVFKPKQPEITAHPIGLEHVNITFFPTLAINATLDMVVTIGNRNYGSFKFGNSTAYMDFHGETVAEVPIGAGLVPARGKLNVTTSAVVMGDKLVENEFFMGDVESGCLNFTSTATLHGKVSVLKIFKMHAIAISSCDISIWIATQNVESKCTSKLKL